MTASPQQVNESFVLSHKGLVRKNNEDRAAVLEIADFNGENALLAVLADGVGGHSAGEIASGIAVDTIIELIGSAHTLDPHAVLDSAILAANQAILDNMEKYPAHNGMGTTCVCVLVIGRKLYAAHLGDSRLYILRDRALSQLTRDHTMLEEYRNLTTLQPDNSNRSHPLAHVLSRYLGSAGSIEIDHHMIGIGQGDHALALKSGDIILLCSDGVTDLLSEDEIKHLLQVHSGRKRAQFLVYQALERGGHDNTTVIVITVP